MARGDAFKPWLVGWLLEQIGIVPIYRIQDGGLAGLKKNEDAYRRVNQLLKNNSKIIVFAEGLCVQERRLRPLKKGVARMVFGAYEAIDDERLVVLPVGVNYSKADKFRSDVFYNIGEPIFVKNFIAQYRENPARANKAFLLALEPKMKDLITHINDKNYDSVVYQVEELCKKDRIKAQKLDHSNLNHDFIVLKQLTETVNLAVEKKPDLVDSFKTSADDYFLQLKKHGLKDWLINPKQNKNVSTTNLIFRILTLLLGAPLYLLGLLGNYLPFKLTEKLTKKILKKNVEFYSSIAIGLSMVFFLLNYILWFIISYLFFENVLQTLMLCMSLALCAGYCLYYHPFLLKTRGMYRILKNKAVKNKLSEKRKNLISLINKF